MIALSRATIKIWNLEVFVNEDLVKVGYAKVATYPPNVKYRDRFIAEEKVAQENKRGMWAK